MHPSELQFSSNGRHLFYNVKETSSNEPNGAKEHVVLDGRAGKAYEEIIPGGLKMIDENTLRYVARDGRKFLRVAVKLQ